jgi:hypothetical protein
MAGCDGLEHMSRAFWLALLFLIGCTTAGGYPLGFWSRDPDPTTGKPIFYRVTENDADPTGWIAEFRPHVYSLAGIPYGRQPQDVFFTTQEGCEMARVTRSYKINTWSSETEVPPSEPCEPVHYRIEK